ncbi:ABC-type oligopeptide transport system, ATPase component [Rothia kristinae]|nr:ABC-type oligopeptide transport system, ATPase component [Rothia kristinae]
MAPPREGETVLELKDVALEYPKQGRVPAFRAVEGANLRIHAGEVVGLVGESGSGSPRSGGPPWGCWMWPRGRWWWPARS